MDAVTRPPSDPVTTPPSRRPGSVRRTSSILMFWPGGAGTDLHLKGTGPRPSHPGPGRARGPGEGRPLRGDEPAARGGQHRGRSGTPRRRPAGRLASRRQPPRLHRPAAARRGGGRHADAPAARRPGRMHPDCRLRLHALDGRAARLPRAHAERTETPHAGHLFRLPTRVGGPVPRRHPVGEAAERGPSVLAERSG